MKKETANNISITIFIMSAFLASNLIGTLTWNILSVAFLIAGIYGIVCSFKNQKFIF
ncbi:MAG: hypothetical protein KKD18_02205 [Nanoarchaeota archaeon]|nr:hypothetical protein [Nanoarchaeota archaeon]MBU0977204.1 hypothetical protein [Nanoarchaeota archaeon]